MQEHTCEAKLPQINGNVVRTIENTCSRQDGVWHEERRVGGEPGAPLRVRERHEPLRWGGPVHGGAAADVTAPETA